MLKFKMEEANGSQGGGGVPAPSAGTSPPPSVVDAPAPAPASAGAAGGAGNAQPGASDGSSKSWLEGLGDLGKDPSLQMFKDPSALAKSWVSAQKLIGAEKVVIPGKEATEEDWAAFYNKIGRPDSAEKYEVKGPDGKDLIADKDFKAIAHKNGLTVNQVKALVEYDQKRFTDMQATQKTQEMAQVRDSLQAYQEKLGGEDKFKATVDKARVAVKALADEDFKELLRQTGLGSRPEAIAFFAKLSGMMGEGQIRDGTGVPFTNEDPAVIQKEIEQIEAEMYSKLDSPNMQNWVERRSKLYERLSGLRNQA